MTDLRGQLAEDKAMRDAAKRLVTNDLVHLRGDYEEKGLAARFVDRMKEGADGAVEEATEFARENPGRAGSLLSLGLGALLAYLFRDQLTELIGTLWNPDDDEALFSQAPETPPKPEPEALSARSDTNPPNFGETR